MAAAEGLAVGEVEVLRALDGADDPTGSRALRTALDMRVALSLSSGWRAGEVGAVSVAEAFRATERTNSRRSGSDAEGRLDIDAALLAERLGGASVHDPWTAAEVVRAAWTGDGFSGRARRAAFLLAPAAVAHGFDCQSARCIPLAAELSRGAAAAAVEDPDAWPAAFFAAVAAGARRAHGALRTMAHELDEADRTMVRGKSNSRNLPATLAFLARPVRSVGGLAEAIGVTTVGSAQILERLSRHGMVSQVEGGAKAKGRQFAWRKAMGL